jgi:hypothetical protein
VVKPDAPESTISANGASGRNSVGAMISARKVDARQGWNMKRTGHRRDSALRHVRSKKRYWQEGFDQEGSRQQGKPEVQFSPRSHLLLSRTP